MKASTSGRSPKRCLSHSITGSFVGRIVQLLLHFLEETIDQTLGSKEAAEP